jgi:hypothetical protein
MSNHNQYQFRLKCVVPLILVAFGWAAQLNAEDIVAVLRTSSRYHNQRVTLSGVLRDEPLELFKNAADAREGDVRKAIWLASPGSQQKSGLYDMRRARVVGIIDANQHGARGNPCALILEKLTVLSSPIMPWEDSVIVFRNETQATIALRFGDPPSQSEVSIPSNDYHKVLSPQLEYSNVVRALTTNGEAIAESKITVGPRTGFYDAKNAASYFRVKDRKIERVSPETARAWGWKR